MTIDFLFRPPSLAEIDVRCSVCGAESKARAHVDMAIVAPPGWLIVCDADESGIRALACASPKCQLFVLESPTAPLRPWRDY